MHEQQRDRLWRFISEQAGPPGQAAWAESVCTTCVDQLRSVDAAAMTLRANPRMQDMLGASDEWADHLEQQQYTLGEGPGFVAFASGRPELVDDLGHDEGRWPGFSNAALSIGAAAVFAFPLRIGAIRLGTVTFYRRRPGAMTPSDLSDATLLVELIVFALLEQAEFAKNAGEDWLRPAGSYQDVDIATGVLSAKLGISLDEAIVRLRAHAFQQSRPIVEVSREILAQRIDAGAFDE